MGCTGVWSHGGYSFSRVGVPISLHCQPSKLPTAPHDCEIILVYHGTLEPAAHIPPALPSPQPADPSQITMCLSSWLLKWGLVIHFTWTVTQQVV